MWLACVYGGSHNLSILIRNEGDYGVNARGRPPSQRHGRSRASHIQKQCFLSGAAQRAD
jgi:hypothetical protein